MWKNRVMPTSHEYTSLQPLHSKLFILTTCFVIAKRDIFQPSVCTDPLHCLLREAHSWSVQYRMMNGSRPHWDQGPIHLRDWFNYNTF